MEMLAARRPILGVVDQRGTSEGDLFSALRDWTLYRGHFQDAAVVEFVRDELRQEIRVIAEPQDEYRRLGVLASETNSVSLHVRRGDYLGSSFYGLCSIDYYQAAMRFIGDRSGALRVFVFSDDIDWARANLDVPADAIFVPGDVEMPTEDLRLMSLCRHHITANSSFSWWGAWLGRDTDGIVVCPTPWIVRRPQWHPAPANWVRLPI